MGSDLESSCLAEMRGTGSVSEAFDRPDHSATINTSPNKQAASKREPEQLDRLTILLRIVAVFGLLSNGTRMSAMPRDNEGGNNAYEHCDAVAAGVLDSYARRPAGASTLDLLKRIPHSSEKKKVPQLPDHVRKEMMLLANAEVDLQQNRKVLWHFRFPLMHIVFLHICGMFVVLLF